MALREGALIAGKYRLESVIGRGGMGAVWRATHLSLGRAVALKSVLSRGEDGELSEEQVQRFLREAQSAAAVRHRNVVDVLDFGQDELGRPFLVMELLEGESLDQRLKREPPPSLADVVDWMSGALSGLAAIHDAGLVHRDLKPANVFLSRDADGIVPKVLDFGIARSTAPGAAQITHTMQTLGTPHYMSPEQVRHAKSVGPRSDIYAIGVMLYQALTGRLPFDGPSATAIIASIVTDDAEPFSSLRPDLPTQVGDVVHKAMARDASARFADARSLRDAIALAARGIDAVAAIDPIATAHEATVVSPSTPRSLESSARSRETPPAAPPPPARTRRRGFFALLGMVSTLSVIALGITTVMQTGGREDAASVAMPVGTSAPMQPTPPPVAMPTTATPEAEVLIPRRPVTATGSVADSSGAAVVTAPLTLGALGRAYRELPVELRATSMMAIALDGDRYALASDARFRELVSALGSAEDATPIDSETFTRGLSPRLLRVSVRGNLRRGPDAASELVATLAEGTIVVALIDGSVDGARSALGEGSWARVAVADGLSGWMSGSLLTVHEGCVPRGSVVGDSAIVTRTELVEAGRAIDGYLVLDEQRRGARVRVYRSDSRCALEPIAELRTRRWQIAELFVTRTAREGGESLLMIGRWPDGGARMPASGQMIWTAHRATDIEAPVWTLELTSGQNLDDRHRDGITGPVSADGVFHALRVRQGGRARYFDWDGATLVESTAAAAE